MAKRPPRLTEVFVPRAPARKDEVGGFDWDKFSKDPSAKHDPLARAFTKDPVKSSSAPSNTPQDDEDENPDFLHIVELRAQDRRAAQSWEEKHNGNPRWRLPGEDDVGFEQPEDGVWVAWDESQHPPVAVAEWHPYDEEWTIIPKEMRSPNRRRVGLGRKA